MLRPEDYEKFMVDYLDALGSGDGEGVASRLSEEVVWHVGGDHELSGTYEGRGNVTQMLGRFKERSGGTVRLVPAAPMVNGDMAAVILQFSARRPGKSMSMQGIDVFRLGPSGVEEVWLFSHDQEAEDDFWGD